MSFNLYKNDNFQNVDNELYLNQLLAYQIEVSTWKSFAMRVKLVALLTRFHRRYSFFDSAFKLGGCPDLYADWVTE